MPKIFSKGEKKKKKTRDPPFFFFSFFLSSSSACPGFVLKVRVGVASRQMDGLVVLEV